MRSPQAGILSGTVWMLGTVAALNVVFWAVMVKLFQVVPSSVYCKRTVLAAVFDQRCSHVNFTFR